MANEIAYNRSALRDFLGSVATVSGDLSNITAPPFVLSENSTVEIPQYWADHPSLFVSQGAEEDAERRSLSVLKYFLGTLRNQQYAGRSEGSGVKKPLNAFLGELFLGHWKDEELGETRLVAEQVSHHPPITACYLWNDKHGVRAQGFTQQEITFSGNVIVKQKGYAMLHLDKWEEDYLIPVPNIKVKGIFGGVPYPELEGDYSLISSNGYISKIKFSGKSFFGSGQKHKFEAKLYHSDRPDQILYTAGGAWNGKITFNDARSGKEIESFNAQKIESVKVQVADLAEQDPWESRNAWQEVVGALNNGNMRGVANAKSRLEDGQRHMREEEQATGKQWQTVFFERKERDPIFDKLSALDPGSFIVDKAGGVWKANREAIQNVRKPYHGDLLPNNERVKTENSPRDSGVDVSEQNGVAVTSAAQDQAADSEETAEANGHVFNNLALRQREINSQERKRAPSISATTYKEPTDEQVEAFLRARHSNAYR
ncbi:Oxysterol-binding protein [Ophiobolus disseminans]|uniref:Oxysterol-binding protein n=1 Tax=Ophiobolus disseminans TaxID=1469910 RepID=A0A6A7A7U8_9PLEO|nr:Oxysterol-binding protein [Ophiobolus disseminans]